VEATIAQAAWGRLFRTAMDAIADCFARREARTTAAEMVTGLLTEVDTRNCWTLAEALGHPAPHRLQHLLSRASFDHERAREAIARLVVRELAGQEVALVADETGDAKSSTGCVGAGRQYSGAIKGVGLWDWAADEERREVAGVPEEITFATKLRQTAATVKNALDLGVRARWFTGDEVYCGHELRRSLREVGLGYAVGVSHAYPVTDGAGRRHRYTCEVSFFRCWAPGNVTLAQLVEVICRRWRIEETFQLGKTFTGLDEGQVTCWNSWMPWSLFSLITAALLALTAAGTTSTNSAEPARLIPLTCPELIRLLRAFVLTPPVRNAEHLPHWMAWRRHHQAVAQACHQRRHTLQDQP
jgi:SRSO17 transposase